MTVVAFSRCPDYSRVEDAVQRVLEPLGGPARFFKPGLRVLLKPNLLSDAAPEKAVTTHPEVVRALIRLARAHGAEPTVADSPAGALRLAAVWDKTGMLRLCEEENTPLLNLEEAGSQSFACDGVPFSIARPVLEAGLVVNLPKVKTHVLTVLTAGVKNLYGVLPGFQKAMLHKAFPTPRDMGRLLAQIADLVKPGLTLADGIVGMDGDGPSGGSPAPLGFLAASTDPAALDAALCRVLAIPPGRVPVFRHIPRERLADLTLAGEPPAPGECVFRLPRTWRNRFIPRGLVKLLEPFVWVRPALDAALCIRCGRCAAACPAHALTTRRDGPPVLTPALCIGCCCCHEMCPVRAIRMTESPLLRILSRGRLT